MAVIDGRTWLEHLQPEECWRLLRATPVGRNRVLVDSAPAIYPVNHLVDGESIVFPTSPGSKLRDLDRSPSVCFQIDGIDPSSHTGWSVLVKGRATIVRGSDEIRRVGRSAPRLLDRGVEARLDPHHTPPRDRSTDLVRHVTTTPANEPPA